MFDWFNICILFLNTSGWLTLSFIIRGGADKSLVRPRRKKPTATKLRIYSTYSPRSSIHFLALCSNLCRHLKKYLEGCPSNQVSAAAVTSLSEKNGDLSIVFSVHGTGGSPTGFDPENRESDQDIGSPGRPVSSGLQVPGEPGHCMQEEDPLMIFLRRFSFKMPFNCTSRDE